MQTKLSRYAEGVMEAAWLAAVIVVPLFFNVYSSRIFEPDKISILRTLALIVLAAWLVKVLEEGRPRWEKIPQGSSRLRTWWEIPLLAPVLVLAATYLLSTLLSVAPRISFFGSYQRLQGFYSTISYIVIFAAILANLRRRAQVNRLITTAILVSLPVSMYGVLQRFQSDPVPWAGNVTRRIASNMGNSIFVAAYLIMVTPLTCGRIVDSFGAILKEEVEFLWAHFARATFYVFIVAMQLIAIYLSGSRGPLLGLLASLFFLSILLSLHWRKRWMTFSIVGLAALLGAFLLLLNVPEGPLETVRNSPWVGRLGQVLDMDQRTSRVRILIWGGAAELVAPHAPLDFPDGSEDNLNFLRPLIGYGPESMHVAYNKFFPPELARLEKRNASPDRSHNETWDALVTTGILGLIIYLVLFAAIFYYGLQWLGLVTSRRQGWLLLLFYFGGGVISAIGFVVTLGIEFFGVGLPFGAIIGLILYLTLRAIAGTMAPPKTEPGQLRNLILIALLSAIVAHFVEINFGIAIAATRTYFWVITGLLLVVGYVMPFHGQFEEGSQPGALVRAAADRKVERGRRRKRRRSERRTQIVALLHQPWMRGALVSGILTGVILATLGYDFISVQALPTTALQAIWKSFTFLPARDANAIGVLAMMFVIWLGAAIVYFAERSARGDVQSWEALPVALVTSLGVALLFWVVHARALIQIAVASTSPQVALIPQALSFENLLTRYYLFLILFLLILASQLPEEWPVRSIGPSVTALLVAPIALVFVLGVAYFTNLRIIQADITFKLADPLTKNGQWDAAIALYDRANAFAFAEDYYYLFLGKAYLDSAEMITDPQTQNDQVKRAEASLEIAQRINPLNTDHTANLARLYRWWASRAGTQEQLLDRGQISSDYYDRAVTLSPFNAALWTEWASLYLGVLQEPDLAFEKLTTAQEVDPFFDATFALLGDYYLRVSQSAPDEAGKREALTQAAIHYGQAVDNLKGTSNQAKRARYTYLVAQAGAYVGTGELDRAIGSYLQAIQEIPTRADIWRVEEAVASLYAQLGEFENALIFARSAMHNAPENDRARLEAFINQFQASP